jgi:hypothetical protein
MKPRIKVRKPIPYNERERNTKVLNLVMQVSEHGLLHELTPEIRKKMDNFVKTGETYIECVELPKLSRQMIIQLINDKHQQTFINFKYVCHEEDCEDKNCCK